MEGVALDLVAEERAPLATGGAGGTGDAVTRLDPALAAGGGSGGVVAGMGAASTVSAACGIAVGGFCESAAVSGLGAMASIAGSGDVRCAIMM